MSRQGVTNNTKIPISFRFAWNQEQKFRYVSRELLAFFSRAEKRAGRKAVLVEKAR